MDKVFEDKEITMVATEKRPYLYEYKYITEVADFYKTDIAQLSSQYDYICAVGPRSFNLAYTFLPKSCRDNLIGSTALLQYHRKIFEYYKENGKLPRILIVDDIIIYGRKISKLINKFENYLMQDMKIELGEEHAQAYGTELIHSIIRAVNIVVFARNEVALLLDDRYRYNLHYKKTLSMKEIFDLVWVINDSFTYWIYPNSNYAYSEKNEELWNKIVKEHNIKNIDVLNYKQMHWKYDHESMGIFLKIDENLYNNISSIRFFPERKKQKWFTSFSFGGQTKMEVIKNQSLQIANILKANGIQNYKNLIDILSTGEVETIGQIISYLKSVSDYRFFLKSIKEYEYINPDENHILNNSNIGYVCRNFAKSKEIMYELSKILCSEDVFKQIENIISSNLKRENATNISLSNRINYDKYNDKILDLMSEIGADNCEEAAKIYYNTIKVPYERYQEYKNGNTNENREYGLISLNEIYNFCNSSFEEKYYIITALIQMIDYGLLNLEIKKSNNTNELVYLCKTNDMISLHYPRKIAPAIHILAQLSKIASSSIITPREMIQLYSQLLEEDTVKKQSGMTDDEWNKSGNALMLQNIKNDLDKITGHIFRSYYAYFQFDSNNLNYTLTPEEKKLIDGMNPFVAYLYNCTDLQSLYNKVKNGKISAKQLALTKKIRDDKNVK